MLKRILFTLLFIYITESRGQTILNGSFENNTAGVDQINLTNVNYNSLMSNSFGFGVLFTIQGNIDIITSSTYCGGPQNGNWFVALTSGGSDAFSLTLSSPLVAGNSYTLSFYDRSGSPYTLGSAVQIGVSNANNDFGTLVYTAPTPIYDGGWSLRTCTFIAPTNGLYITVKCDGPLDGGPWTQVDNFTFDCALNLNLGNDTTLCQGQSIALNGGTAASYLWSNGSTNASINVSNSGSYWVQTTDGGCSATDSIVISYNPYPTFSFGNDTTLCQGQSVVLNGAAASSFIWSNGSTASSINVSASGTFWLKASNGPCSTSDTVVVSVNPYPTFNFGNDTTLCQGQSVVLNGGTASSYLWSSGSNASSIIVSSSGTFWLKASNGSCSATDTITISILPIAALNFGNDTTLCTGQSITLNGGLASSYLWSNGSTASSIIVSSPGSFWLQLDNGRCSGADTLSVYFADCEMEIEMPNVFTPNFDGLNDNFIPTQYQGISKASIRIFNRWGEEVFFSEDLMTGWNGTCKDNTCSDGTYFWIVKYNTNMNESKELKGFLMLTK
jgi:gliding motility-associated-like protein